MAAGLGWRNRSQPGTAEPTQANKAACAPGAGVPRDCGFPESTGTLIREGRFTLGAQRTSFLVCLGAGHQQHEQRLAEIPRAVLRAAVSAGTWGSDPQSLSPQGSLPTGLVHLGSFGFVAVLALRKRLIQAQICETGSQIPASL